MTSPQGDRPSSRNSKTLINHCQACLLVEELIRQFYVKEGPGEKLMDIRFWLTTYIFTVVPQRLNSLTIPLHHVTQQSHSYRFSSYTTLSFNTPLRCVKLYKLSLHLVLGSSSVASLSRSWRSNSFVRGYMGGPVYLIAPNEACCFLRSDLNVSISRFISRIWDLNYSLL